MADKEIKGSILNFKVSEHLKEEIQTHARRNGMSPSKFVREVVKKFIKYKEPEVL